MVQLASFGNFRPESELPSKAAAAEEAAAPAPVKLEIEDPLDEQHGPLNKRSKITASLQQQWSETADMVAPQALQYNLLHEPSPLGLRLRKSPSLVDLIQMRLSQANGISKSSDVGKKVTSAMGALAADKMKASNFPASLLRIGTWEYVSTYEGDLVAKCYFAKHKLVWEVLHGGLKSKIEIQWSDITSLKATCPENGPETLDVVLARQPLFFREVNPQPRKHTLWQATSDFTDGQASIHRRHFLQCSQGLLSKHVEKLILCDPRLYALSQQPNIILENPYFERGCSVFKDQDESKCHGFDNLKDAYGSPMRGFQDSGSPHSSSSMSTKSEVKDPIGRAADVMAQDTRSPSSVMDTRVTEEQATSETEELKDPRRANQFKVPELQPSMSVSDLMNHIGHSISEQINSGNPLSSGNGLPTKDMLEEMTRYLLSDSQTSSVYDEKSLMLRVNSLCSLIQKDPGHADQFKVPGVRPSMSMSDLVNHIGHCISEQINSGNPPSSGDGPPTKDMLEEMTRYLLSDSQTSSVYDEKSLMLRVNSLCNLIQEDPGTAQSLQINSGNNAAGDDVTDNASKLGLTTERKPLFDFPAPEGEPSDASGYRQPAKISRRESFGELLMHLPRIASLHQFLVNISEDAGNEAR